MAWRRQFSACSLNIMIRSPLVTTPIVPHDASAFPSGVYRIRRSFSHGATALVSAATLTVEPSSVTSPGQPRACARSCIISNSPRALQPELFTELQPAKFVLSALVPLVSRAHALDCLFRKRSPITLTTMPAPVELGQTLEAKSDVPGLCSRRTSAKSLLRWRSETFGARAAARCRTGA